MDIQALDREFTQGSYKHHDLSEYQFLRRFCALTQPGTITVVGGHTNLDLFYAVQECEPRVTNWDPGNTSSTESIRAHHTRFKQITAFRGEYQWIPQSVAHLDMVDMAVDLLWLNALPSDPQAVADWPTSVIFCHDGNLTQTGVVMQIHRQRPLVALGRHIAVHTDQTHDWAHHTYGLRQDRNLGPIRPVTEIVR
jgi:hypothetical protein